MSISLFLVGGGVGLLIITFVSPVGDTFLWPGLMLIGLGGIIAIAEIIAETTKGRSRSHDPETGKAHSLTPSIVAASTALLIFGLIAYIIWSFFNWLPGPI